MSGKVINVGFIGNPNCGKTTLFNAYTGANLKVGQLAGRDRGEERRPDDLQGTGVQAHRPSGHLQPDLLYNGGESVPRVHHER